jgi:hypothetical protein
MRTKRPPTQFLIRQVRSLYAKERFCVKLKQSFYPFQAGIFDLPFSFFPWDQFRQRKEAIKPSHSYGFARKQSHPDLRNPLQIHKVSLQDHSSQGRIVAKGSWVHHDEMAVHFMLRSKRVFF